MEKLVLIHHALFESLEKQILYCVVLRKKDFESQKLEYFFLFFFSFISSLSISFIYERFLLLFLNFKSGYLLVATFFASCRQFENVQHIRTSALILENLSLSSSICSFPTARLLFIPEDKKISHGEDIYET